MHFFCENEFIYTAIICLFFGFYLMNSYIIDLKKEYDTKLKEYKKELKYIKEFIDKNK